MDGLISAAQAVGHPQPRKPSARVASVLEMSAVTDPTKARCRGKAVRLLAWRGWLAHDFSTANPPGVFGVAFLADLALGELDSAADRMAMAALGHSPLQWLGGRRPLPRAARALGGWRRFVPPRRRPPPPKAATTTGTGWLILRIPPCRATVFPAYLRPSEASRLFGGLLLPPIAGTGFNAWSSIVSNARSSRPGITEAMGVPVLVNGPELWPALHVLTLNAAPVVCFWIPKAAEVGAKLVQAPQVASVGDQAFSGKAELIMTRYLSDPPPLPVTGRAAPAVPRVAKRAPVLTRR